MKYLISLLAAVSLLAGCGGADVSPQLPVVSSGVEWKQQPDIQGTHGTRDYGMGTQDARAGRRGR